MKFLRKNSKAEKIVLVISDLHLGAGAFLNGKKNLLEDFQSDQELVDFLEFYSTGSYANKEVELIINGDFLDPLAVPYVPYFDDEYWSEKAALEKLKLIINGHAEVFKALNDFLTVKKKNIVYIIGNHDAEMVFPSLKTLFLEQFEEENRGKLRLENALHTYEPAPGVFVQHGHEYEHAHNIDLETSVIESTRGNLYFMPPWGSYYVTHVINKYKQEREHVNQVRPINNFLIHGLIFDTYFTLRFMIANAYYYIMVRFLYYYRQTKRLRKVFEDAMKELSLFQNYEDLTRSFFESHPEAKVLIVGHTHEPTLREYEDKTTFINTGTWTRMVHLDLGHMKGGSALTFAHIELNKKNYDLNEFHKNVSIDLFQWRGKTDLPYQEY
jgi:UDP-2,3-diacylglucosamine pyrophosphatase LpxH